VDAPSDEELFRAHVAGDAEAFRELFARYAPLVRRIMARDVRRAAEVDELVQDTFLHLHRSAADFRQGAPLKPWLVTIALNLKREHFRRKARRPEAPLELDGRRDPAVDPPRVLEERDARRHVDEALAALAENQREVIVLHWFGGLSFPEVAQVVGASVSAVKVRAHRGYERMRALLAGRV
jgi:RNA polymerase sigma factor (sigma-70 family)